jgi:peptidyl-prolyl cis-trans isomerase C
VPPERIDAGLEARLLHELLQLEAAAAVGAKAADPKALSLAEIARLESLAQSAAEAKGLFAAPSDADLRAEYRKYVSGLPANEFHAAHILTAGENAAAIVVTQLQGGADFGVVATQVSLDESKSRGGDLGWIRPGHLPTEFFDSLKTLKPGEFTTQPFKTAYGWHVLKLIDMRASAPPAFDDVKAQLIVNLQQERYRRFLEKSLAAAKVERSTGSGSK